MKLNIPAPAAAADAAAADAAADAEAAAPEAPVYRKDHFEYVKNHRKE